MIIYSKILNQQTAIEREKRVLDRLELIHRHFVYGYTFFIKVHESEHGYYFTCYYMGNSDKAVKNYRGDAVHSTVSLAMLDGISYCLTDFFGFVLSSSGLGAKLSAIRNALLKRRSELYAKQTQLF